MSTPLVRQNDQVNLALLKIAYQSLRAFLLELTGTTFIPGQAIYTVGSNGSVALSQVLTAGSLTGKRTRWDNQWLQTDVLASSGNIGGPVISQEGKLIGIINASVILAGEKAVACVIPIGEVRNYLGVFYR